MARRVVSVLAVVAALLAVSCGGDDADLEAAQDVEGIRVASFNFAESELLAEMYAQAIESTGTPVRRLGAIGPREIVAPSLELGRIDLVPEYLGSALGFWGSEDTETDPESAHAELNELLAPRGLETLALSPAQDQNVFAVTSETAESLGLVTLSDLLEVAPTQRFGGPPECVDRALCLAGLESVYGLRFAEFVPQRTVAFTAEALRRDEIEVGLLFSTSPELADPELVALEDDRGLQPAESVVPVIGSDARSRWPAVAEVLDRLSSRLTTIDLRFLNARASNGEPVDELAREWLAENLPPESE